MYVPIGIVGPLTGPRADYGDLLCTAAFAGAALALRECPGGRAPRLLIDDDAADPPTACEAAHRLIRAGVEAVVGHFNSDAAAAAGPIYRAAGVPLLLPAATRDGLARDVSAFRMCPTDADQVRALAAALARTDCVVLASDSTPYAARLAAGLRTHPLLFGCIRDEADLRGSAPRNADAIVFLGTHGAILDALGRWHASGDLDKRRLLACDDCSLPMFGASLPPGVQIDVASPLPDFATATYDAVILVMRSAQTERTTIAENLAANSFFDSDGESYSAKFRVVRASSH